MQSFIVLGLVPGTNIQLNFNFWLAATIVLMSMPAVRALWHRRDLLHTYLIALHISRVIARHQLLA